MGGYILEDIATYPELDDTFSIHFATRYHKKDIQFKEILIILIAIRR